MRAKQLIVSSRYRWVADDLTEAAARAELVLRHDIGFDVPSGLTDTTVWWVPTGHAARLKHAGVHMPLLAPGPAFLDRIPNVLLGRTVHTLTAAEVCSTLHGPGFGKLSEMKLDAVPARWYDTAEAFTHALEDAGVHPDAQVQWTGTRLDLAGEYRCYVVDGQAATISPYLLHGQPWEPDMIEAPACDVPSAAAFTADVLADTSLAGHCGQPPTWVLDVAVTTVGRWVVLEANPAWSSGTYSCDSDAVVAALTRATDLTGAHAPWRWQPDPHLLHWARRRPLRGLWQPPTLR